MSRVEKRFGCMRSACAPQRHAGGRCMTTSCRLTARGASWLHRRGSSGAAGKSGARLTQPRSPDALSRRRHAAALRARLAASRCQRDHSGCRVLRHRVGLRQTWVRALQPRVEEMTGAASTTRRSRSLPAIRRPRRRCARSDAATSNPRRRLAAVGGSPHGLRSACATRGAAPWPATARGARRLGASPPPALHLAFLS